VLEGPFDP